MDTLNDDVRAVVGANNATTRSMVQGTGPKTGDEVSIRKLRRVGDVIQADGVTTPSQICEDNSDGGLEVREMDSSLVDSALEGLSRELDGVSSESA